MKTDYQSPDMLLCIIPQEALLDQSGGVTTPDVYEENVSEW